MAESDLKMYFRVFLQEPAEIISEAKHLLSLIDSEANYKILEDAFGNTVKLFKGFLKGYQASKTKYHNLDHTLAVFLAAARLVHGTVVTGREIDTDIILLGLISALFHDVGLIQTEDDREGTGAKYTIGHEERSIEFMKDYLRAKDFYVDHLNDGAHIIGCTITDLSLTEIPFRSKELKLMGQIVGSADLLAQMADRLYLEKLLYLYKEFQEGKIPGFESEFDLLKKTESFYKNVSKKRLEKELGGATALMRAHFKNRRGVDRDFYQENIEKNIKYLTTVILKYEKNYRQMLRRAGIVADLEKVST